MKKEAGEAPSARAYPKKSKNVNNEPTQHNECQIATLRQHEKAITTSKLGPRCSTAHLSWHVQLIKSQIRFFPLKWDDSPVYWSRYME